MVRLTNAVGINSTLDLCLSPTDYSKHLSEAITNKHSHSHIPQYNQKPLATAKTRSRKTRLHSESLMRTINQNHGLLFSSTHFRRITFPQILRFLNSQYHEFSDLFPLLANLISAHQTKEMFKTYASEIRIFPPE